jgi:hypothetical protein
MPSVTIATLCEEHMYVFFCNALYIHSNGPFKMVQSNVPLSSIAPYICPSTLLRTMSLSNGTFLKRP